MTISESQAQEPFYFTRLSLFHGAPATFFTYQLDTEELARREAHNLDPLCELDLLDTLMNLPLGYPVPLHDLSAGARRVIDRAPAGTVQLESGWITRLARQAVDVRFALVEAPIWQTGLFYADRYARFCSRAMLLPFEPSDPISRTEMQLQAEHRGIGAYTHDGRRGALRELVAPGLKVSGRRRPGRWQLAEFVLHQLFQSPTPTHVPRQIRRLS